MIGPTAALPAARIFLLSPAHTGGKRAGLLLGGRGRFPLAEHLRDGGAVPLGEAFSFLSGLYFRGKVTYARRFARPAAGAPGVQVITSNRGLLPEETLVTADDLRGFAETDIHADEPRYREPLRRDVERLESARRPDEAPPQLVLLGSVASPKYVNVLLDVVGERLLFPSEFVGRGDLSRGGLLLRAARADHELTYEPVATAVLHGQRSRKLEPSDAEQDDPHHRLPAAPDRR